MDHEDDYIREVPSYYKHTWKKDRTFIINKQAPARPTVLHNMIKRDILLSEVSAWLLQYVHIAWCDGPLCNIAQTNWTLEEKCDWTSKERMSQVDRLHPCKRDNMTIWYDGYSSPLVDTDKHRRVNTRTDHTHKKAHTGTISSIPYIPWLKTWFS